MEPTLDRLIELDSIIAKQQIDFADLTTYREFYNGDHPVMLTDRQKEFLGPLGTDEDYPLVHNICEIVVDTLSERLSIHSVDSPEAEESTFFSDLLEFNNIDELQSDLNTCFFRDGTAYLMVSYDEDEKLPVIKVHELYDGQSGIYSHIDLNDTSRTLFDSKYFYDNSLASNPVEAVETVEKKTVYFDDRVEKYQLGSNNSWELLEILELPFNASPVFRFSNKGRSELHRLIGFQNALNKAWLDLLSAADASGFPVLAFEYNHSKDEGYNINREDTPEIPFSPLTAIEIYNGKVTRLQSGNLQGLMDVIWSITTAISSLSKVPQHQLQPIGFNSNLSNESLRQIEAPLIKKVESKSKLLGSQWTNVFNYCAKLQNHYTNLNIPESHNHVTWDPFTEIDDLQDATIASRHLELGVPQSQVYRMLGYTDEKIKEFLNERTVEEQQRINQIISQLGENPNGAAS